MSLTPERTAELQELCRQYRIDVLTAIHGAQSGHPGGSLSVCEILTLLYQQRMHVDAAHPDDPDRDRLVLCKGHAAPMLYRNLIGKGFLPPESMNTLRQTGSPLQGHPCMRTPGVDMPSGPLGIGLAAGIMARLGFMKSFPKALITACVAGFVAVLISTPLNVIFWGGTTGNVWGDMVFAATQAAGLSTLLGSFLDEIVVDVPDKIITLIVVYFVLKGLPRKLTALYDANAKIEHLE